MLLLSRLALHLGRHGLGIVTVPAFLRIGLLHAQPDALGEFEATRLKLFLGIDCAGQMVEDIVRSLDLAHGSSQEIMGHMTIGADRLDARPVLRVDGVFVFLEIVVLHFVAGNTEFNGIRLVKGVLATGKNQAADQQQAQRPPRE